MIEALTLRTQVAELLNTQIGSYSLEGITAVAIAVLPDPDVGYNYPPAGTVVSGLEVVIMQPVNDYVGMMGGGMAPATWEIRLKQHDGDRNLVAIANSLVPALANLLSYARMGQPIMIPPNAAKGIVEQVVIRATEYIALS